MFHPLCDLDYFPTTRPAVAYPTTNDIDSAVHKAVRGALLRLEDHTPAEGPEVYREIASVREAHDDAHDRGVDAHNR